MRISSVPSLVLVCHWLLWPPLNQTVSTQEGRDLNGKSFPCPTGFVQMRASISLILFRINRLDSECDLQSALKLLFTFSINRGESVESFPGLSRNSSRTTERDWDNGSTASSITSTSMAEYTGEFSHPIL